MKVFIVDDSVVVRDRLITMLSDLSGIDVVGHARDTHVAMGAIKALNPDVVILDLNIPGKGGIKVLQYTKQELPATKVVILTNYAYPQYRKRCLEAGAEVFLDKSTEFERIPVVFAEWMQPLPQHKSDHQ